MMKQLTNAEWLRHIADDFDGAGRIRPAIIPGMPEHIQIADELACQLSEKFREIATEIEATNEPTT